MKSTPLAWTLAWLLAVLRVGLDHLGFRGNDGFTRPERRVLAERYRARIERPLTDEERAAVARWRVERARDVKRAGGAS
ncbi:hypothetical protein [Antribacter gilvus]|uniref:hypothetical protein n=1 Tax=Antribacter gilvus TaxID=2304675 RepID=UPI000F7AF186|nr:hypothetical protein [Antribacter gilvus]